MRATITVNIVVHSGEVVTMDLLLARAEQLKGLTIHGFEGVAVHDAILMPALAEVSSPKLVRYAIDCEGPDELLGKLLESSSDFIDDAPSGGEPFPLGGRLWLPGYSPVSGGRGQLERQLEVLAAVPVPPPSMAMHFRVDGYTRRGQDFDMESLGYVVLGAWRHDLSRSGPVKLVDAYQPESIWLTMRLASDERIGMQLADEMPPETRREDIVVEITIAQPPGESIRGTVLPELVGSAPLLDSDWLGLSLTFGAAVDIGEFGFYGPIKPLIDAMGPLLGRDRRGGPADHRLHDLRITRDSRSDSSVQARFWYAEG